MSGLSSEPTAAYFEAYPEAKDNEYGTTDVVKDAPEWIKLGCGDKEYICEEKGATFKSGDEVKSQDDLKDHNSVVADVLKTEAGWKAYQEIKDKKTKLNVSIGNCIKTGIDNKGHPMIKTVGMVAGDEESFELFKPLFDPVCSKRHGDHDMSLKHESCMDPSKLSAIEIDPKAGQEDAYVLTTRCRTGRSVSGYPLPPCCSFQDRRDIEKHLVDGLNNLTGDLAGKYIGLYGSKSADACGGKAMDKEQEEDLRNRGNLFQEPDSTLLLSSGCGRHWPDARGIFHNEAKNFFVWVNEEDHSRIISMQKGAAIKEIFQRFATATQVIEEAMKKNDKHFMKTDSHGWVLTCPSNLGTGLRAGAMVKVPKVSALEGFKNICKQMHLQARGTAGVDSASTGGTWDISNADRLGFPETVLCNFFIEGVSRVIRWEQMMEDGKTEADIQALCDKFVADSIPLVKQGKVAKDLPDYETYNFKIEA